MSLPRRLLRSLRDDHGITGLETAIVLIAFVVVASVFAFVVLSTGLFASERGKETVYAGLAKTRGSIQITGGIIATSDGTKLTNIALDVTLAAGGDQVNLSPTDPTNRTVISYQDNSFSLADVDYTVTVITGNPDNLLSNGELFELSIDLTQPAMAAVTLGTNQRFTFEIKPPQGSYLVVQRMTPPSISNTVINLN